MATSTPRQSSGSPPTSHEDFRPNSEWKKEEEQQQSLEVLLVYLPGFFKEQLKVSTEGTDILRIRGECLVGSNKWRRFQEDFRIPEDCNIRGIRAKFEGETLTITMPKKKKTSTDGSSGIAQLVGPKEESQLGGAPRPPPQDTKDKQPRYYEKVHHEEQEEDIQHQKAQLTSDDAKRVDDNDGAADNKSSSTGVQFPSPQTSSPKYQKGKTTTTTGGGGQDYDTTTTTTPPKFTSTVISDGKQTDDRQKVLEESSKLPPDQKAKAAAATEPKSQKKKGRQDETPMSSTGVVDKQQEDGKGVGSTGKIVQQENTERKERSERLMPTEKDYTERKAKQTTDVRSGGGGGGFEVEKYKQKQKKQQQQQQTVKGGLAANKGHLIMNKDKQLLMVNMGVAVLVIVALGAYVSYTLGYSSGKPKN